LAIMESKICPICGNEISMYSCGRKISAPNYRNRKYCSRNCKAIAQKTTQRKENPRHNERLYHVWQGMKQRCNNPNSVSAKWYHDRGICVCEEWEHDYEVFKEWALLNGYDETKTRKEQSLDRIDSNKGYSPTNCRFVTHSQNCQNTRRNIWIEYNGERMIISEWSRKLSVPIETLRNRYRKGLSPQEILFGEKLSSHKSNTGIKGISWQEKYKRYVVYVNHKYLGERKSLDEAIKLRNGTE